MTPGEAEDLARLLQETWRLSTSQRVWVQELEQLERGPAQATYYRLRRDSKTAPSIAAFLEQYVSYVTPSEAQAGCVDCNYTGWKQARPLVMPSMYGDSVYEQLTACDCPLGQTMLPVQRRINADNERNRQATGRFTIPAVHEPPQQQAAF